LASITAENNTARLAVPQRIAVWRIRGAFMYHEHFEAWAVRIDIGHVHRIAVAESSDIARRCALWRHDVHRAVEQMAVVVDRRRAVNNFVEAVAVDISRTERVSTLRRNRTELRIGTRAAMRTVIEWVRHNDRPTVDVPLLP